MAGRDRPTFFLRLHAVMSLSSTLIRQAVAPVEGPEFAVYSALSLQPSTPSELADRLGLPLTTASTRIARLVERGHATSVRNPADGRSILVELTPAGREQLARLQPRFRELYESVRDRLELPEEELDAALDAFAAALREELGERGRRPVTRSVVEADPPAEARPLARARQSRGT